MADLRAANSSYAVIEPPSAKLKILLAAVATAAAIGLSIELAPDLSQSTLWPVSWAVSAGALLVLAILCLLQWRRSVMLESGVLVIRAGIHTRRVPAAALELERARIIDLEERTELLPGRRTLGISSSGYQAGWFRTRQWGKGFYLLTERRRVLWLPERDGPHLLISLQQPQSLLAALNAMAPRRDPG
ncbi:hypothetical protein [Lysobacter tyrosinilyticus]